MKCVVNKLTSFIGLVLVSVVFFYASYWVVGYFEAQEKKTPEWVYYAFMVVYFLVISVFYDGFMKAFNKKDNQDKN